jgi:hypothetical protein
MRTSAVAAALFASLGLASGARAEKVDLLLVLAADVSRSIDDGEFNLQRKGYVAAMTDPRVLRAIASAPNHAIAVIFVEWAGAPEQNVVVDWTVIRDEEGAGVVAATMLSAPRSFLGRTSISAAIDFAMERFASAPAEADKRIIDVSGDGTNNSGRAVTEARDQAVSAGVTINGLAIINTQTNPGYAFHTQPPGGLPKYYEENVIGGPGAFLLQVENFDTFAEAVTRKLVSEVAGLPTRQQTASVRLPRLGTRTIASQSKGSRLDLVLPDMDGYELKPRSLARTQGSEAGDDLSDAPTD